MLNNDIQGDPNANYDIMEKFFTDTINKYVPLSSVKVQKDKHKKSEWITTGLIKSIKF